MLLDCKLKTSEARRRLSVFRTDGYAQFALPFQAAFNFCREYLQFWSIQERRLVLSDLGHGGKCQLTNALIRISYQLGKRPQEARILSFVHRPDCRETENRRWVFRHIQNDGAAACIVKLVETQCRVGRDAVVRIRS